MIYQESEDIWPYCGILWLWEEIDRSLCIALPTLRKMIYQEMLNVYSLENDSGFIGVYKVSSPDQKIETTQDSSVTELL